MITYSVQEPRPGTSPSVRAPELSLSGCVKVDSRLDNPTPVATSNLCPILISETVRLTNTNAYVEFDKSGAIGTGKTSATLVISEMDPAPFEGIMSESSSKKQKDDVKVEQKVESSACKRCELDKKEDHSNPDQPERC